MKVEIEVSPQKIADMMVTAVERNDMTRAWCSGFHRKAGPRRKPGAGIWYSIPEFWAGEFRVDVIEFDETGNSADRVHTLDRVAVEQGIAIMADKHPKHFADWLADDYDAITADVFLQCCVLKEVVYG